MLACLTGRIEFVTFGPVVHLPLLPTPPRGGAVAFDYARMHVRAAGTRTLLSVCAHGRTGARGLRGVLESAWMENETAGDGGLQRSGIPFTFAVACTEAPRPSRRHKLTVQPPKGRASRPCLPLRGMTGEPHANDKPPRRQGRQGVPQCWSYGAK